MEELPLLPIVFEYLSPCNAFLCFVVVHPSVDLLCAVLHTSKRNKVQKSLILLPLHGSSSQSFFSQSDVRGSLEHSPTILPLSCKCQWQQQKLPSTLGGLRTRGSLLRLNPRWELMSGNVFCLGCVYTSVSVGSNSIILKQPPDHLLIPHSGLVNRRAWVCVSQVLSGEQQDGKLCPTGTPSGLQPGNVDTRIWTRYWPLEKQQSRGRADTFDLGHHSKACSE